MLKYIFAIWTCVLILPSFAHADTVLRVGDAITVDESQIVEGDYYVSVGPFGNTTMSGTVNGDMYGLGGTVTTNGSIAEDLVVVSGVTQMHSAVADDVRILSGEVTIAEDIGGDLFVIGGTLNVLSTATISGNVFFFGGDGVIDGSVEGAVFGTSNHLRIDGSVGGNVDVTTTELTLGSKASIQGDVSFTSIRPLVRAPEAVIEGNLQPRTHVEEDSKSEARNILIPIFITLFATLSLFLLFREELIKLVYRIDTSYASAGLVGIGVVVIGPLVAVLLMATVLGLFVGFMSLAVMILFYVVGFSLMSVVAGAIIAKFVTKHLTVSLTWILVGALFVHSVVLIPIIGPFVIFVLFTMTVGGIAKSAYSLIS